MKTGAMPNPSLVVVDPTAMASESVIRRWSCAEREDCRKKVQIDRAASAVSKKRTANSVGAWAFKCASGISAVRWVAFSRRCRQAAYS